MQHLNDTTISKRIITIPKDVSTRTSTIFALRCVPPRPTRPVPQEMSRKKSRRNEAEDGAVADDDNPKNIFNAAVRLHKTGRFNAAYSMYEKALKCFERLLEADPENTQFLFDVAKIQSNLGILLWYMRRLEEAKKRYERALELVKGQEDPRFTGSTLALLGRLELDKDAPDLETAQSYLELGVEKLRKDIKPFYSDVVSWLALCYYKRGEQKKREARKEKEKPASNSLQKNLLNSIP